MNTISVVIPTYNRATLVGGAIRSALEQTSVPNEIIVVDDGSTDSTAEVVAAFPQPVRYLRSENGGASRARNAGIAAAASEWVTFLDDDDLFEPEKIAATRMAIHRYPDSHVIASDVTFVKPSGGTQGLFELRRRSAPPGGDILHDPLDWALASCFFLHSLAVRRDVLEGVGGFTPGLWYEDFDIVSRLAIRHRWVIDGRRLARIIRREDGGTNLSAEWSKNPIRAYASLISIYEGLVAQLPSENPHHALCRRRLMDYSFELGCAHVLDGDRAGASRAFGQCVTLDQSVRNRLRIEVARMLGRPWIEHRRRRQLACMTQARG